MTKEILSTLEYVHIFGEKPKTEKRGGRRIIESSYKGNTTHFCVTHVQVESCSAESRRVVRA